MQKFANYLLIEQQDNIYSLHLTPELQDDIGTVGLVKFTEDKSVKKNETIVVIEASKTIFSINTPLAGTIVEINKEAINNPKYLNSSKLEQNWLIKLTNVDQKEFLKLEDY
ncbi:glycine cleavage system protein H [Mesomycoplasma hyorhinis]|uniref:glycine cleavage system protein H n=1 Tax=Mesomycoplasma hyorhinis TaxID=2100 RepID=UPI001C043117|nr:biotin/lipoyl-containing protein [Mesomycoplasma hyorhinis]